MATLLKLSTFGDEREVRVSEEPSRISSVLAVASREHHPFVVFTNADTGKEESFDPSRVISFAAE